MHVTAANLIGFISPPPLQVRTSVEEDSNVTAGAKSVNERCFVYMYSDLDSQANVRGNV
nr:hypothetical protein Iba_chr08eCG5760 [Ipomoea batatas]